MKKLFSLLLILGLAAELLPACTDAEASTDYVSGAAARRSRGDSCEFEAPTDHFWDFEPDASDADYLQVANIDALEADDFTVFVLINIEDNTDGLHSPVSQYNNNQISWYLANNDDDIEAGTSKNHCVNTDLSNDTAVLPQGEMILIAMTYDYSGNAGVADSTLKVWVRDAGGWETATNAGATGPIADCTGVFTIGSLGSSEAALAIDGKIYAVGYYASTFIEADLESIYDSTKHPACDFTPVLYWDGSKAVAGTYVTEVGGYTLTVNGTPVQGP